MPKKIKVYLDTNIIISGLLTKSGHPYQIITLLQHRKLELVTSDQAITELTTALTKIKTLKKYHLSQAILQKMLWTIRQAKSIKTEQQTTSPKVRDPKDQYLLDACLQGNVQFLITGDQDLLILNHNPKIGTLKIITPKYFLVAYRKLTQQKTRLG